MSDERTPGRSVTPSQQRTARELAESLHATCVTLIEVRDTLHASGWYDTALCINEAIRHMMIAALKLRTYKDRDGV